jgi:hypothetical protein
VWDILLDEPLVPTMCKEVDIGSKVGNVTVVDGDIGENGIIDYLLTCK